MSDKQYFIAFFGGHYPDNTKEIKNAISTYSDCKPIMDRVYMIESDNPQDTPSSIRDKIMTEHNYHVIVARFNETFSSAWCMPYNSSEFLTQLYNKIVNG